PRFFLIGGSLVGLFIISYLFSFLFPVVVVGTLGFILIFLLDLWMLYRFPQAVTGSRVLTEKFSNGDPNPVEIHLANLYPHNVYLSVKDEIPFQFQIRDQDISVILPPGQQEIIRYELTPVARGEYHFGVINVFVASPLKMIKRRYQLGEPDMVPTYPSFVQMRKYQLVAISNRLTMDGIKKIRRLGNSSEFEQIKDYVRGDDYRTINWKATARTGKLMVNQFTDEKAQNIYCLIDKSRGMKMPFQGMTLLDYAINASLVLINIAIRKSDKGGLVTFANKIHSYLPASKKATHIQKVMEVLYNQETRFLESDYHRLYAFTKRSISHRSLLVLFTNFETLNAMRRQLPYLKMLAKNHLLLVVFFENTELRELLSSAPQNIEDMYIKTIGEGFSFEKRQIVKELETHGIASILTPPENLTINSVNKYLEIKARGMI
ncbi:MAG: DUF58 domain-containing protein, partial [Bacteroidota bacterium]